MTESTSGPMTGELLPLEIDEYLTWLRLERGRAASTVSAYRRDLTAWAAHLRVLGRAVPEVTEDDLVGWVHELQRSGLARATVKRRVVAARNLHRFLAEEGATGSDPGADVAPPPAARGLPKALTEGEITRLIESVGGHDPVARRDRAILETLYGTGVRISELVGLSLRDLDLHDGFMRVIGKGDKERVVPVLGAAHDALAAWLTLEGRGELIPKRWRRRDDEQAVFLNQRGGRLGRQGTWLVVKAHGERAGIGDRLTPHVLRHSCATHLLDHGADIRAVQELLGHASIGTTQIYTKVSDERLVSAWRAAHPRAG
jgi:integrase/recombinase XerD